MQEVLDAALRDAESLASNGVDAILVENMQDTPYLRGSVFPETVAAAARIVSEIVGLGLPTGVQLLAAANREALGVAVAAGAQFIRVEGFAYAHVADEGWIDACAGPLLRARAAMGSKVAVWADIQKKHSAHAVTADLDIPSWAEGAAFCGADALVITGRSTGHTTSPADVAAAAGPGLPVVVGSGVTAENAADYRHASAVIVGSWLKVGGAWRQPVDPDRVAKLAEALSARS